MIVIRGAILPDKTTSLPLGQAQRRSSPLARTVCRLFSMAYIFTTQTVLEILTHTTCSCRGKEPACAVAVWAQGSEFEHFDYEDVAKLWQWRSLPIYLAVIWDFCVLCHGRILPLVRQSPFRPTVIFLDTLILGW